MGLNVFDSIDVPSGGSGLFKTFCIPNAWAILPATCSNLTTLISENDKINTKNAINKVAMSAKVAIHKGAPFLQTGHSSASSSSSAGASAAAPSSAPSWPSSAPSWPSIGSSWPCSPSAATGALGFSSASVFSSAMIVSP